MPGTAPAIRMQGVLNLTGSWVGLGEWGGGVVGCACKVTYAIQDCRQTEPRVAENATQTLYV